MKVIQTKLFFFGILDLFITEEKWKPRSNDRVKISVGLITEKEVGSLKRCIEFINGEVMANVGEYFWRCH